MEQPKISTLNESISEYIKLVKTVDYSANQGNVHESSISSIAFLCNHYLVSGDKNGKLALWKLPSLEQSIELAQEHEKTITSLADLGENRFASGSADNKIIIWNTQTGNKELILDNNARAESLARLENNRLASASGNKIFVWNLSSGQLVNTLTGHSNTVSSIVALSNNRLASGSYKSIRIWDIESGKTQEKWTPNNTGWTKNLWTLNSEKFGEVIISFSDLGKELNIWSTSENINGEKNPLELTKLPLNLETFKESLNIHFEDLNKGLISGIIMKIVKALIGKYIKPVIEDGDYDDDDDDDSDF